MLEIANTKCSPYPIEFIHSTLEDYSPPYCDVIIFNLCLQFTNPNTRLNTLRRYTNVLKNNGVLILVEKVALEEKNNKTITTLYHNLKRDAGYSDDEIRNKDIALKGILNPLSEHDNLKLMTDSGLNNINTLFTWGPFHAWCAHK